MQWNAGGWFGGQVGATLWMLISGALTAVRDLSTGLTVIALFACANVVGLTLWLRRRLSCYASIQLLLAVSGICGLTTVYLLENKNLWSRNQTGGQVTALSTYWIIVLVFGGIMLMFHFRFGRDASGR